MSLTRSHGYVLLASLGFSFIYVFATLLRNSGMSGLEQAMLRISFSLVIIVAFLLLKGVLKLPSTKHMLFFFSMGSVWGIFLLFALYSIALGVPIAVAVALTYTQPIYTSAISFATRKEKVSLPKLLFMAVGVAGALMAAGVYLSDFAQIRTGVLFGALSGVLYAVYLWLKRNVKTAAYKPLQTLSNTMIFSIPAVFIMSLIIMTLVPNVALTGLALPDNRQLALVALFAVFSTILPYGALNLVRPKDLRPVTEGILLLLDVPLNITWSVLIFSQVIFPLQYVGIGLIVLSVALKMVYRK